MMPSVQGIAKAALLASYASAQLLINPYLNAHLHAGDLKSQIVSSLQQVQDQRQHPLIHTPFPGASLQSSDLPAYKTGQFSVTAQDNTTCASYGEKQWTGTVDVTDERRLFFWFFDSRNDPANDPVVLWLNGGPGGSSMMGLFDEMGPCTLELDADETVPNPWAWNNNASLLFIDQPAGVGFSSLKEGARIPGGDLDGAQDFQMFLNIFFRDVFPERASLPIHLAAESYGGHYAPTYVDHILKSRAYDSRTAFWGNISSLILVDALVDFVAPSVGSYELLCSDYRGGDIVNATACEAMRLNLPECERLGRSCEASYDGLECLAMITFCMSTVDSWYWERVEKGERNPFNINLPCPVETFPVCEDPTKGNFTAYLNQKHIKEALGFPSSFTYNSINFDINTAYTLGGSSFKPTTHEIASVLDAHTTPGLGDVKILVLNGNEDYVVNTPGNAWVYNNLLWSGQPEYRIAKWERLDAEEFAGAAAGFWKGTRDGRLVFVGVDGAGHEVPGDVKEGSYRILQKWIEGGFVQT